MASNWRGEPASSVQWPGPCGWTAVCCAHVAMADNTHLPALAIWGTAGGWAIVVVPIFRDLLCYMRVCVYACVCLCVCVHTCVQHTSALLGVRVDRLAISHVGRKKAAVCLSGPSAQVRWGRRAGCSQRSRDCVIRSGLDLVWLHDLMQKWQNPGGWTLNFPFGALTPINMCTYLFTVMLMLKSENNLYIIKHIY